LKVFPTLQIRQGRSVAQPHGTHSTCPHEQVASLLDRGHQRLSFIDVDAAQGRGNNRELIGELMRSCRSASQRVCLQVGGGIRGCDQVQYYLDQGATWLLVGTLIHKSPMVVENLLARFHEHLTAAVDTRGNEVCAYGWEHRTGRSAAEVAQHVRSLRFRRILFVDVASSQGSTPDFATARQILEHARMPMFMWSTFRQADDLMEATRLQGLQGVQLDAGTALSMDEHLRAFAAPCS